MKEIIIHNEEELPTVAGELITSHPNDRVFAFFGEMGSGKTTLIKEICRQLGVQDDMTSPTFAIVNEYSRFPGDGYEPVFHFDFYRIDGPEDALRIGFHDYIYSGNYCFLEWPENVLPLLEDDYVTVKIEQMDDKYRKITF